MAMSVPAAARTVAEPGLRWRWTRHVEIGCLSLASLLLEIAYTRVVSFKLFYYYVYLVIGLALLGIGAGGVLVAVSGRLKRLRTDTVVFGGFALGAAVTVGAYALVASVHIDTLSIWRYTLGSSGPGNSSSALNLVLLVVVCIAVFASFVGPGVAVATVFARDPGSIGGLYAADLAGAALACATVVWAVGHLGAPGTVMLAAAFLSAGAAWVGLRVHAAAAGGGVVLLAICAVLVAAPGNLPAQRVDASKYFVKPADPAIYSAWGPVFRVDVAHAPGAPDVLNLYHDGILGAAIYRWNGEKSFLQRYGFPNDARSIPFSVLGRAPEREAVIGAAGGHEVLASLAYGAHHVDAVELNPVTVDLVRGTLAGFDGHLAQDPAVNYVNADGRSYIARSTMHDDLIWYPAPDSYAATNGALSSAYVLSESYLYTTDALRTMLSHLAPGGIFVAQFGEDDNVHDLRTTRFVATARQALAEMGIVRPDGHIMVAETQTHFLGTIPLSTIVVSRSTFTPAQVGGFTTAVQRVPETSVLVAPGVPARPNPVRSVVSASGAGLASFYSSFPYNVTPTSDNAPYFWHFARYGTVVSHMAQPLTSVDREDSVGERVLLLLLALSVVVAVAFLLVPFVKVRRTWRAMESKGLHALFFAGVGFGFIFFEVTLMQLLNLFLGYPTYAVTVTLAALLVSAGAGAAASRRVEHAERVLPRLLFAMLGLGIFYLAGLPPLTRALLSWPLGARLAVTVVLLAPLGACMGLFMPVGLRRVAGPDASNGPYVAWGWAVNGFASVVGSVLATMLSMTFGFRAVLGLGLVAYAAAVGAWTLAGRARTAPPGAKSAGTSSSEPALVSGS